MRLDGLARGDCRGCCRAGNHSRGAMVVVPAGGAWGWLLRTERMPGSRARGTGRPPSGLRPAALLARAKGPDEVVKRAAQAGGPSRCVP